jgi:hypothetical protein
VEILWEVGLAPQHKASQLSDEQLEALSHALLDIPRLSYNTRGVVDETSTTGRCSGSRCFIGRGSASGAAGLSTGLCSLRDRFTGVHIARNKKR